MKNFIENLIPKLNVKKKIALLMALCLAIATMLPSFAKAAEVSTELNDNDNLDIDIIVDTDEMMIYKTKEDGQEFLYEEETKGDITKTSKYLLNGDEKQLVENYETKIVVKDDNISITKNDYITNETHKESINLTEIEKEIEKEQSEITPMATATWVKTKAGTKMGYYKYKTGGGKARHSTNEKKITKYNKYFDNFCDRVDTMKNIESSALWDALPLAVIPAIIKLGKNPSLAAVKNVLKKLAKGLPLVGLSISLVKYVYNYDKAVTAINKMPGSYYKW
ncbi:hypothetical protein J6TS2_08830 [Heyndrickxia sporothermodurans]|nr:hypothetical protein J6TS2_08830 [Heyndrickxia sporothermodurans]